MLVNTGRFGGALEHNRAQRGAKFDAVVFDALFVDGFAPKGAPV